MIVSSDPGTALSRRCTCDQQHPHTAVSAEFRNRVGLSH